MERGDRDREHRTVRRESSLKYSQKKNEHEVMNYKPIQPIDWVDEIIYPDSGPELNDRDLKIFFKVLMGLGEKEEEWSGPGLPIIKTGPHQLRAHSQPSDWTYESWSCWND